MLHASGQDVSGAPKGAPGEMNEIHNRKTICLSMIVKNEAPVIRRCLSSVLPIIDYWDIIDTGSTDGTQDIIRDYLKGLPGELHERQWKDFAYNRSEALSFARAHGDYSLIIDADDTLEIPTDFELPELTADSYTLEINDANICYRRTQLVRNALPWRYEGVLHEFLTCDSAQTTDHLSIAMRRNHDGARRRNPQTYKNDAAILEQALSLETSPFLISRYRFYLAQSYRDCKEREKALQNYLVRAELGFWQEEVFVSLLSAARLKEELGHPEQEVLDAYRRAWEASPTRAEALHGASRYCRFKNRFEEGYQFAKRALSIVKPTDGLFIEPWIYDYGLLDELAVNGYWSGHYRDSLDACQRLLSEAQVPEEMRDRVKKNLDFAVAKINERSTDSSWTPGSPAGGTELMVAGLESRIREKLDLIQLHVNICPDSISDEKPLVMWMHHDVNQDAVQWCRDSTLVNRVTCFVFVSHWQRERYQSVFRLPPNRCVVLRNATAIDGPRRLWTKTNPLRFAYTSTPFRGLSVLLDAWEQLGLSGSELHIWSSMRLYNFDDANYEPIFARARALKGVIYHGIAPNPDLKAELRNIDFLVYPSTFEETSCLAVIDAMAAGCRVIVPALGALPETTSGFAHVYPWSHDPAEHATLIASAITEEIENSWLGAPEMSLMQQNFCELFFDWKERAAEWNRLIERLTIKTRTVDPYRANTLHADMDSNNHPTER
jgi:glycosyltransferase involved in cell wall biosynthesis